MGHVKVLISKVLTEVEKIMVALIRGLKWKRGLLEAMKTGGIGSSRVSGVWYLAGVALVKG
jgi:acid phosphatase family membrane protein YuiD